MNNIDIIRQKIEGLKKKLEECTYYLDNSQQALGYSFALDDFKEFIDSLPEEKTSEDIKDAAYTYSFESRPSVYGQVDVIDAFIAGAEWQKKQLLKGSPLPEDTVLFQKGVEEGKRLMMEEAVEGEIGYWNQRGLSIRLDKSLERLGYDMDTKVKIVIVKQDDRPRD